MGTFLAAAFLFIAQQTATLEGSVIKLGTTEPLPGTRVGLVKPDGGSTSRTTTTGGDGKFRFADVEPGTYRVVAMRDDGFLPAEYGQTKPNVRGLPISLGIGDAKTGVQLAMAPPASITGRIFDRDGDPIANAQVQALRSFYRNGRRALTIVQSVTTNDLGEYRLFWLAPGAYYITAKTEDLNARRAVQTFIRRPEDQFQMFHDETSPPFVSKRILENGESVEEVQVPTYFPSTTDLEMAKAVPIRPGDDVRGLDINIKDLPPARRARGTVIDGATGQPLAGAALRAFLKTSGPNVSIPFATANDKGAFDVAGLIPGSYHLFDFQSAILESVRLA